MNEFRAGRFVDFVGLSIEAGIEQGSLAFRRIVQEDLNWYESRVPPVIARSIATGFLHVGAQIVRDFTTILVTLKAANDAFFIKFGHELKEAASAIGHTIVQSILKGIADGARQITGPMELLARSLRIPNIVNNKVVRQLDAMVDKVENLSKKSKLLDASNQAPSFAEVLTLQLAEAHDQADTVFGFIDESLSTLKKVTDFRSDAADEAERELTATEKLSKLLDQSQRVREAAAAQDQTEKDKILQNSQGQGGESPSNPGSPLSPQLNPAERMAEQILQFQEVTTAAATVMQGMFNGISNSIQGLINGTMRWGDALRNIAGSIVQSIIQSFADMAAAYIVNQLIIQTVMKKTSAVGSALRAKETTQTIAAETSKKPALATNATLASVGSFGAAAIIGLALVTAAIAAMAGGFKSGGYTGDGPANKVAGVVHGKEVVLHAGATRNYREIAEAMNAGARPEVLEAMIASKAGSRSALSMGASASSRAASSVRPQSAPASSGASPNLNVAIVDDRQSMREWATSTEGRRTLLRLTQQNQTELGLPS